MTLTDQLREYIEAAFTGLWLQTWEPYEAEQEIHELCRAEAWDMSRWDIASGCTWPGAGTPAPDTKDPLAVLDQAEAKYNGLGTCVLILHNYHRFLSNPVVVQRLANHLHRGKEQRWFVIVLTPIVSIPVELEKLFVVLEHPLPDADALRTIANELILGDHDAPTHRNESPVVSAAAGLTRQEAEGAFALSLSRHDEIKPEVIWELKAQTLKKNNLLSLHRGKERFADIGGLEALKKFCTSALRHLRPSKGHDSMGGDLPDLPNAVKPKGILLLGVPDTGKSFFAKALGNEVGRPCLNADPGSWKGSLVGESGQKTRQAFKAADAMSPAILFIDEIEKAFAGATSQHQGDSGVSADQLGSMLTWMNDHETDVFVIATSNDISKLPPEFCRAERWDAIFFIDLPKKDEQLAIWDMYVEHFHLTGLEDGGFEWRDWTGAEIKACCRLAALMDISIQEAAQNVIPVAVTASDKVSALREWASGRCLSASEPGIYRSTKTPTNNVSRRRVQRPERN